MSHSPSTGGAAVAPPRPAVPTRRLALMVASAALVALGYAFYAAPAKASGAPTALIETNTVQAPRGFSELCARRPEICPARSAQGDLGHMEAAFARIYGGGALATLAPELTEHRWKQMVRVNHAVNATIRPVADSGADHWAISSTVGDCEEYVLMKREMLARLGWPRSALRITVVRDGQGYHAVLVVSTSGGEFVLDNMTQEITRVEHSPYQFVVAQSQQNPGQWVRVSLAR